jgi:hypothetical protein
VATFFKFSQDRAHMPRKRSTHLCRGAWADVSWASSGLDDSINLVRERERERVRMRAGVRAVVLMLAGCLAWLAGSSDRALAAAPWLGLNGNSAKYLGPVDTFSRYGISYDRSFELIAGELPSELERGFETAEFEKRLAQDNADGMTPVVVVEYRGYDRSGFTFKSDPEFPRQRDPQEEREGRNTIAGYVAGFVRSASRILALVRERYPGMEVLFEPMNEPWGYTTPQYYAREYADVIARVLPAAKAAGIPLSDVYVGATGAARFATERPEEAPRRNPAGWVRAMYEAQPSLETEIQGWYLHPYGPPRGTANGAMDDGVGIESVPLLRAKMTSGENNMIISEVGFCDHEVDEEQCSASHYPSYPFVGNGTQAAEALTETLETAKSYHEAGWLRALIIYSRNDRGWAMQRIHAKHVQLTQMGKALVAFAEPQQTATLAGVASARAEAAGRAELARHPCAVTPLCAAVETLPWIR